MLSGIKNVKHSVHIGLNGELRCPKRIPVARTHRYFHYLCCMKVGAGLFAGYLLNNDFPKVLCIGSLCTIATATWEFLRRIAYCIEEYSYLESRYDGRIANLLNAVFQTNVSVLVAGLMSFAPLLVYGLEKISDNTDWCWLLMAILVKDILSGMQMERSPLSVAKQLSMMDGMDIGTHMATSYFHGYLKIVLPSDPSGNSGLRSLMDNYESHHSIQFARHCLYILIPLSMECPHQVTSASKMMEEASTLDCMELNRAGVRNRNYKNSVYKIKCERNKFLYVCAEYASPLKTLHEVIESNSPNAESYKRFQKDILLQFYLTLTNLISSNHEIADICEPIFFDDKNNQVDVAKVILERLTLNRQSKLG